MILLMSVHPFCRIIIAHDKTWKVLGKRKRKAVAKGKGKAVAKGKGKAVVKGNIQGGGDDEDGDGEHDDEDAIDDPSHRDGHKLSAQFIVQQAS